MSVTIDICATDDTGFKLLDYRWLARFSRGTEIRVVSVMDLTNQVLALARQKNARVGNLYINGHGAPGYQSVGAGTLVDETGALSLRLDEEMADLYWKPQLKGVAASIGLIMLNGIWADDAMVTLLGCRVAEGADGKNLIAAVATTMCVWVRACDANQYSWLPGYEGQIWLSDPYGTVYCGSDIYK
jgi:hypothetical protein